MATAKSDNPLENATLAKLATAENGEPYVYVTRTGKDRVTFPDLAEMTWDEGERFMADMLELRESQWIKKWLSVDDWKTFQAEDLKMKELVPLVRDIVVHYQNVFGSPGEDETSRS